MRLFFIYLLLSITAIAFGQIHTGKLVDSGNQKPLAGATVLNLSDSTYQLTDTNGHFEYLAGTSFSFRLLGFKGIEATAPDNEEWNISIAIDPLLLEGITISAVPFTPTYLAYAGASSVLTPEMIAQSDLTLPVMIFNQQPGIYMQSGALNTNRITIRGIGSRSPFATNKIRAYFEGIPLTDGIGETTIEDIDLSLLGNVSILKGPSSSLFGAGLGGVIDIRRVKPRNSEHYLKSDFSYGSFGLTRQSISLGSNWKSGDVLMNFSRQTSVGYRDNNEFERKSLITGASFYSDKDKVDLIGMFLLQTAYIPSSLSKEDYKQNPTEAAASWGKARGYEDYFKMLMGISWAHSLSEKINLKTSFYSTFRDAFEARPFNILDESVTGMGIRSVLTREVEKGLSMAAGFELYQDWYVWKTYENLYEQYTGGSVQGYLLTDFAEKRSYRNIFGEIRWAMTNKWSLDVGLNFNQTYYQLSDDFSVDSLDQSGFHGFDAIVSPRAAIHFQWSEANAVYGLMSHGFSPPSLEETLNPEGTINPDIQPETGWNLEIGAKGAIMNNKIHYDLSAYSMQIKNLLVARRTALDQYVGINAGATVHNGV